MIEVKLGEHFCNSNHKSKPPTSDVSVAHNHKHIFDNSDAIFFLALYGKLHKYCISCIHLVLSVHGHRVDGAQKASIVLTSSCTQRGGVAVCSDGSPSHILFGVWSSSPYLQPPPPRTLVDKTPTPPSANSRSAPRLHGYAGLLSEIKPLNPLFAVWWKREPAALLQQLSTESWLITKILKKA